jgi:putative Ca2+/H+ antiporter (TMEM165/GDT1 family)
MDLKVLGVVFGTVFLAELGDKTQLATVLFASKQSTSLLTVFVGASLALLCATGLAVAAGSFISHTINPKYLSYIAGAGFIIIGVWTIVSAFME